MQADRAMIRENRRVRIPNPHGSDIDGALLLGIIQLAGITREEWERA